MPGKHNSIAIIACIALAGCAPLADEETGPPPLATITGTLSLADGTAIPDDELRLAVLWQTTGRFDEGAENAGVCVNPDGSTTPAALSLTLLTEQQVDIDATFPSQFVLNLTSPPPEPIDPDRKTAGGRVPKGLGFLVAYADGNANGKLDSRTGGEVPPDRVLATSWYDYWRTFAPEDDLQVLLGYSPAPQDILDHLTAQTSLHYPAGYSQTRVSQPDGLPVARVEPIETSIELELTGAAYLQDITCETPCNTVDLSFECPTSPIDLPQAPQDAVRFMQDAASIHDGETYIVEQQGRGWSHGADGHSTSIDACFSDPSNGLRYTWQRTVCESCTCRHAYCEYYETTEIDDSGGVEVNPAVAELCAARE
jgi:hypothetical protein